MHSIIWLIIFIVGWFILQRYVLPRFGVPT